MKIGIVGYGNLGKALERRAYAACDVSEAFIFSRRSVVPLYYEAKPYEKIMEFKNKLDVLLIAGGSTADLPEMTPELAAHFNVVDSFDNHNEIKNHLSRVDKAAVEGGRSAIISSGWDPGLFSVFRAYMSAFFENSSIASFWGPGVSQGHSEAARRISGVEYAIEYTIPNESAVKLAENGEKICKRDSHKRICYLVASKRDEARIESELKSIPEYFKGYETEVHFISKADFLKNHTAHFHAGRVIAKEAFFGKKSLCELILKMDSNPDLTAGIMLAFARAALRFYKNADFGAKAPTDVPPSFLESFLSSAYDML